MNENKGTSQADQQIQQPVKKGNIYRKQFCASSVLNSRILKHERQTGIKESNMFVIAIEQYLSSKNY